MSGRLSIIAGSGALVSELVAAAVAAGWQTQILALSQRPPLPGAELLSASLSDPRAIIEAVRAFGATDLCLAGGVTLDGPAREQLLRALGAARPAGTGTGDSAISSFSGALEAATGARLVGAHTIAPQILTAEGHLAGPVPNPRAAKLAALALAAAIKSGSLDLGQALVSADSRILAVEDIAGTDALLARIAQYRRDGLIAPGETLVLAKAAKPGQSMLIDLPAIGPATLDHAAAAKITLITLAAGQTLILERSKTFACADRLGITILGLPNPDG